MSDRAKHSTVRRAAAAAAALAVAMTLSGQAAIAQAADPATPPTGTGASSTDAVPAPAPAPQPATITGVRCEKATLRVEWKGAGVAVVDYRSDGEPLLASRSDPAATDTSVEFPLGKEAAGRKIDVRLWDKDTKLLATKQVSCKAAAK